MKRLFLLSLVLVMAMSSGRAVAAEIYTVTPSSGWTHYENNSIAKVADGSFATKFWSNVAQNVGGYVMLDMGAVSPLDQINLYFASGDKPVKANVQISSDNSAWETVATFSTSDIGGAATNYLYSCNAAGKLARYVRMAIAESSTSWFQMTEFQLLIPAVAERTVTVTENNPDMGTAYIGAVGTKTVTRSGSITVTAMAAEDYKLKNWTLDGTVISDQASFTDNTEGDKTYVANFVEKSAYDKMCKPTIVSVSNPSFITNAEIVNATGVLGEIDFSGIAKEKNQVGVTPEVEAYAGATFGIKYKFTCNWNTQIFYQIEKGNTESPVKTYGPYENGWCSGCNTNQALVAMKADGLDVDLDANTAVIPVTLSESLQPGDIVVIRHMCGSPITGPCSSISDANYVDILFKIVESPYRVTVASSDEEMGDVYIDTKGNKKKDVSKDGTETVTLTAEAAEGYHLVAWSLNGAEVSTDAVYTTTPVTEDRNYTAEFAFTLVDPRQVTVVSSNNSKGTVAITYPVTSETSINTGDIVRVEATPATENDFFVNWTDGSGNVLGTSTSYKYDQAPAITMTANFVTKYIITADQSAGGTMTVKDGDRTINTGDRVAEGATITISIKADNGKGLDQLFINGVDVYVEGQDVYTTTVTGATTIMPVYGQPKCRLYYSYEGAGYIEVWSSDTYDDQNPDILAQPDGDQYAMSELLPYQENIYVFAYPYGDGELQSLTINDEDVYDPNDPETDIKKYGDVQREAVGPIRIKAVFTGVSTGVENNVSEAGVKVYVLSGGIVINSESAVTAEIFTAGGELIAAPSVSGNSTVSIASGFYIVRVNGAAYKVSVK